MSNHLFPTACKASLKNPENNFQTSNLDPQRESKINCITFGLKNVKSSLRILKTVVIKTLEI